MQGCLPQVKLGNRCSALIKIIHVRLVSSCGKCGCN